MAKLIMCGKHAKIYKSGSYYRVVSAYTNKPICTVKSCAYALSIAVDAEEIAFLDSRLYNVGGVLRGV